MERSYHLGLLASLVVNFVSCQLVDPLNNRIIGGVETTIEHLPFQLALEGGGNHLCGGSVISENWALTAAHCVKDRPAAWLAFRAGSSLLKSGGTLHPVQNIKVHEKYTRKPIDYDVAVVRVRTPFKYSWQLRPVALPNSLPRRSEPTWVSGWGYLEDARLRKPTTLMMVEIYVVPWADCKKLYGQYFTETMLCAGFIDKDSCTGDSGGPLVRETKWGYEQVGIVSWGYKCGGNLPSVYTNVSAVLPWIMKNSEQTLNVEETFIFPTK